MTREIQIRNIGAFCLRMREIRSVRLQMARRNTPTFRSCQIGAAFA
jgi:hypothetical protein